MSARDKLQGAARQVYDYLKVRGITDPTQLIMLAVSTFASQLGVPAAQVPRIVAMVRAVGQWESGLNPTIPGDNGTSIGVFQLRMAGGKGTGFTAQELSDPVLNVVIGADYLTRLAAEGLKAGGPEEAARRMVLDVGGQNPDRSTPEAAARVQQYVNYVSVAGGGKEVEIQDQTTQGAQGGGGLAAVGNWPKIEDYTVPITDAYGNVTGQQTDWTSYMTALSDVTMAYVGAGQPLPSDAPQMAQMIYDTLSKDQASTASQERRANLASYIDTMVGALGADIAERRLTLDQAQAEFDRRLSAADSATRAWENAMKWTLPPGAKYVPGYEPGGIATKVGMEPWEASPVKYDPFEEYNKIVAGTPDLTAGTGQPTQASNLFQQALGLVRGGQGEAQIVAPGSAPGAATVSPTVPRAATPDVISRGSVPQPPVQSQPVRTPPAGAPTSYDPNSGWAFVNGKWKYIGRNTGPGAAYPNPGIA